HGRRLVPDRRRRVDRPRGLRADRRPHEGPHQVRWRGALVHRRRDDDHRPSQGPRGGCHRGAAPGVGGAPARLRRADARRRACGTGSAPRRLAHRLAGLGSIVATDLNEAMFAHARTRLPGHGDAQYRTADGTSLPFESGSFDAVVCQFGLALFPDTGAGTREAYRVLKPGGIYLLNVWDALERNPVPRIAHETIVKFFPLDPPRFSTVPFAHPDRGALETLLRDAGFTDVRCEVV